MPKDRSISPQRETRKRRRSRSASRDKDRGKDKDRDINRDRNRDRDRDRSKDRERDGERERSKGRERDRDPDRKKRRHDRSRSKSRHRRRSPRADSRDRRSKKDHKSRRSRSRSGDNDDVVFVGEQKPHHQKTGPDNKGKSLVDLTSTDMDNKSNTESNDQEMDSDAVMMKLMGFGSFDSTKGKKVENNEEGAKRVVGKMRKYRQYMNRPGGFNKPLDPSY